MSDLFVAFPLIFLGFGLVLDASGEGGVELDAHDDTIEIAATLILALVLFLDAVKLQVDELGRR